MRVSTKYTFGLFIVAHQASYHFALLIAGRSCARKYALNHNYGCTKQLIGLAHMF